MSNRIGNDVFNFKKDYVEWFSSLQNHIISVLEGIEKDYADHYGGEPSVFSSKSWQRLDDTQEDQNGGGGTMRVLSNGMVFEKAGVNVSTVHGCFSKEFAKEIPGTDGEGAFWASGISLVIHPKNPYIPIVHMNTRHIATPTKAWFGGGADLTPCLPFEDDTLAFHQAMKDACDTYHPKAYDQYKAWCDTYFYLPHRKEPRGVGGIFFDYLLSDNPTADFDFLKAVGLAYIDVYEQIVRRRMHLSYGDQEKAIQLHKRGRYAEFNLIYDRGTRFGLMTNGHTEAILMSLPPVATWGVEAA